MGLSETEMLARVHGIVGKTELATSAIALTELLHGIHRARTSEVRLRRQNFVADFMRDVVVHPYLMATAELAGRIGGEQAALGQTIPPIDLMIGATALSLGFAILTANLRHFSMIPNLRVIPF